MCRIVLLSVMQLSTISTSNPAEKAVQRSVFLTVISYILNGDSTKAHSSRVTFYRVDKHYFVRFSLNVFFCFHLFRQSFILTCTSETCWSFVKRRIFSFKRIHLQDQERYTFFKKENELPPPRISSTFFWRTDFVTGSFCLNRAMYLSFCLDGVGRSMSEIA